MTSSDLTTTVAPDAGLSLVLHVNEQPTTHALPRTGTVVIGSDPSCDIVADEGLDARHARLACGDTVTIENLGAGGTSIRGERLGEPRALQVGELFFLGPVSAILVRAGTPQPRRRKVLSREDFDARLDEECCRSSRSGNAFALVRVSLDAERAAIPQLFFDVLRAYDLVGVLSPTEYALLLVEVSPGEGEIAARRLQAALAQTSVAHVLSTAHFGRDGRTPEVLWARAEALLRGEPTPIVNPTIAWTGSPDAPDATIQHVASGTISVLITGETGVGKDVLAETLHRLSPRANKPFLRLNCAALAPTLLESELFGHERGAFTGAVQTKPGLLETAHGGSVFLDEIGELPLSSQVKLLRVVEERRVLRVGGLRSHPIDVRFIAATNRELDGEMNSGTFRRDLYYRLSGITLHVEPLRKRTREIGPLARRFVAEISAQSGRPPPELSAEALHVLEAHDWPGNIRELRNVIERAVLLCRNGLIQPGHLLVTPTPRSATPAAPQGSERLAPEAMSLGGESEREKMMAALAHTGGNQTRAAELLGVSRRTFVYRMATYGLPRPRKSKP